MKTALIAIVASLSLSALAAGEEAKSAAPSPAATNVAKRSVRQSVARYAMKRYGGKVAKPNSAKGKIVFVNTQKTVDEAVLKRLVEELKHVYGYTMEITGTDVKSGYGQIVIRLQDLDREERIILAPENLWVSVNVKGLAADNPPAITLKDRFVKEVKRAYAMVCCGTAADYAGSLLAPMMKLENLDAFPGIDYTPDVTCRMADNMPAAGMRPVEVRKYTEALAEGWAPEPTNDFQRAFWEEYHAKPTKPIEIKFDKKLGK